MYKGHVQEPWSWFPFHTYSLARSDTNGKPSLAANGRKCSESVAPISSIRSGVSPLDAIDSKAEQTFRIKRILPYWSLWVMSYSICFQPLSLINLALLPSSIVNCNVSTLPMGSFNSRLLLDEMYDLITKHCLFFSLNITLRASKSDHLITLVFSRATGFVILIQGNKKLSIY